MSKTTSVPTVLLRVIRRAGLIACATALAAIAARAAELSGHVTFEGRPVPGVTVTATQGDQRVTTSTDRSGAYTLDLDDGDWTIRVEMIGFTPMTQHVIVAPQSHLNQHAWALSMTKFEDIIDELASDHAAPAAASSPLTAIASETGVSPTNRRTQAAGGNRATGGFQRAGVKRVSGAAGVTAADADESRESALGAGEGFLVNGSVNNGAATPFAQSPAFGNDRRQVRQRRSTMIGIAGRSSAWDARPFGATLKPEYDNVNVSAAMSNHLVIPGIIRNGPLITFLFDRSANDVARTSSILVPTLLERAGDLSASRDGLGRPVRLVDPSTGDIIRNSVISPSRISPQAAALLAYYPQPNLDTGVGANFQSATVSATRQLSITARIESFAVTSRDQLSGLISIQRQTTRSTSLFGFVDTSDARTSNGTVNWSHRLSPYFLVHAQDQVDSQLNTLTPFFANRLNVSGEAGIEGNNQDPINWGPPRLTFATSLASLATSQYSFKRNLANSVAVDAQWGHNRHSVKFGGLVKSGHIDSTSEANPRGAFFFDGAATGSDLGDFLLGIPRSSSVIFGNAAKAFRTSSYAAFVSDDLRIGPRLSIVFGVRWEYEAPLTEQLGRIANLDVAPGFSAVSPVTGNDPVGRLTGQTYPLSLVRPDRAGFQPRIGVAWRPISGSSLILRAGYGVYENAGVYQIIAERLAQQPPFSVTMNATNGAATPLSLATGFASSSTITASSFAIDPAFRAGRSHNWQTLVQKDLRGGLTVSLAYLGTRGAHLVQQFMPNTYPLGEVNPCGVCPSGFVYVTSGGSSLRHEGGVQIRRRLRGGFSAGATYAIARGIDDAPSFTEVADGAIAQDWRHLEAERAPSDFDQRHRFGVQFQYTTGVGQGLLGRDGARHGLLGGWTISADLRAVSGLPMTPVVATLVPGTTTIGVRPSLTGAPVDAPPQGYFANPAAYRPPPPGQWGDAARNSLRGPAQTTINASLSRAFRVRQMNLNWTATANNLLNRVVFSGVNMVVGSAQFGLPTSTLDMRTIRTTLRITF